MTLKIDFGKRFAEACDTREPAHIQRLLNIPYQSAKNYLNGRLPHAEVLILISQRTGYSIDWLLTGRGKKFTDPVGDPDTPSATGQIEESVRRFVVEVINELNPVNHPAQPKTIRLQSSDVMSEEVPAERESSTGRRR